METKELAEALRAEAERLGNTAGNYTGWQAVQVSLRKIAEALAADAESPEK